MLSFNNGNFAAVFADFLWLVEGLGFVLIAKQRFSCYTFQTINMNPALISLVVTVVLFIVAIILGFKLGRSPRPYPKNVLVPHILLFFAITYGIGDCLTRIAGGTTVMSLTKIALFVALTSLWLSLASGIVMLCIKRKNRGWTMAHKLTMFSAALSFVATGIFMVMKW